MSCRRHQHDLSRCLDGRLPAKARARAMQHLDGCPRCATVWTQMRAAQNAVLGLDEVRVGSGFREAVWARIQAGEGAAEVALDPQVSAATKLRYGLIGAAAATILLAAQHQWRSTRGAGATGASDAQVARSESAAPSPDGVTPIADSPQLARRGALGTEPDPGAAERAESRVVRLEGSAAGGSAATALAFLPSFLHGKGAPATFDVFDCATQAAGQVRSASRRLSLQASLLDRAPEQIPPERWDSVRGDLRQIEGGLDLLSRMEQAGLLELNGNARDCFLVARSTLRAQRPDLPKELQGAVRLLTSCPLDNVTDAILFPSRALGDSKWLLRVIETYPDYRDAAKAFETLQFRIIVRNPDGTLHDMSGQQHGGLRIRSSYTPMPRPRVGAENTRDGD